MHSWITKYKIAMSLMLILLSFTGVASSKLPFSANTSTLPVEQAFILNVSQENDSVHAKWQIANGSYLYQEKLQLSLFDQEGKERWVSQKKDLPGAIVVEDPYFGTQSIYRETLDVSIPLRTYLKETAKSTLFLQAEYQGCSESGFCYPPQAQWFEIQIADHKITSAFPLQHNPLENINHSGQSDKTLVESSENSALDDLKKKPEETKHILGAIATFYFIGILLSFTPCVLPMIPILFGIIVGQKHLNTRKAFRISLTYVLSMAITYALAGIVVAKLGKNLQAHFQYPIVIILFAALFVVLGLMQIGVIYIKIPRYFSVKEILTKLHAKQESGTYIGAAIMGVLATLISSPCVTAPLIGALGYISQSGNVLLGGSALLAMGLGMGTVLLILGTLGGKYIPKAGVWMHTVNRVFAIAMFAFSIWLLDRVFHGPWILVLSAALCFYIAWCLMTTHTHKNWYHGLGFLFVLYALILLWGAFLKQTNPFTPLLYNPWKNAIHSFTEPTVHFETVHSVAALDQVQTLAKEQGRPMIGIFSAEWCTNCRQLEATVFTDPAILKELKDWEVVHLDVTKFSNKDAQALLQKFGVVGPPAILFFNKMGQELESHRIIGVVTVKDFKQQLKAVRQELSK